jgi:hypothetical protein
MQGSQSPLGNSFSASTSEVFINTAFGSPMGPVEIFDPRHLLNLRSVLEKGFYSAVLIKPVRSEMVIQRFSANRTINRQTKCRPPKCNYVAGKIIAWRGIVESQVDTWQQRPRGANCS